LNLERIKEPYRFLLERLLELILARLGDDLVSVVVYGSVARGSPKKKIAT